MIEIDGSRGEGGGQILRSALSLAAILQKEIRVFNIRAGRSQPGLKAQHLTGARAVATISEGSVQGLEIGSTELVFRPGPVKGGSYRFDVGTAGSITLVLQALMPLLPFASEETRLEVIGGTDVKWSPTIDYLRLVILPILERMGFSMSCDVLSRGHYPKGGGLVKVSSRPTRLMSFLKGIDRGRIIAVDGVSHAVGLGGHVAERQAEEASKVLTARGLPTPDIRVDVSQSGPQLGPGSGIMLRAKTDRSTVLGSDSLGERGLPAEQVGRTAAQMLVEEIEAQTFLDRHMGDIIVPYLVLAKGDSEVSISQVTQHVLTNIEVAEIVAGVQFDPVGEIGKPGRLKVPGLGFSPTSPPSSPTKPRLFDDS